MKKNRPTTVCVANEKGGVGKTRTIIELAKHASDRNLDVLVVDLDPQGNTTLILTGTDEIPDEQPTSFDVIMQPDEISPSDVILQASSDWKNVHVIAGSVDLSTAQNHLAGKVGWEKRLLKFLNRVEKNYDFILIDTGPQITVLTHIAIRAATKLLIPTDYSLTSFNGIRSVREVAKDLQSDSGLILEDLKIIVTAAHKEGALSNIKAASKLRETFGKDFLKDLIIPHRITVNNSLWNLDTPVSAKSLEKKGSPLYDAYAKLTDTML